MFRAVMLVSEDQILIDTFIQDVFQYSETVIRFPNNYSFMIMQREVLEQVQHVVLFDNIPPQELEFIQSLGINVVGVECRNITLPVKIISFADVVKGLLTDS